MNEWRSLYNSLSETCADYDKRCKEECEKKYRDEISKLQNIVTEKEVEIKDLKKDNVYLNQNNALADAIFEKNTKLNQTISDQEITIKALLITIKEMCKEDETNA
jgi:gas vesicle protein